MTELLERHQIVCSHQMLTEFAEVMSRQKFADISRSEVDSFLTILLRRATIVSVKQILKVIAEDPEDNIVLTTALQGNASFIVSGDNHLLGLKRFKGVKVVTVEEMLLIAQLA
jgi:putative PIN family toxin of toxin-antitoxin system